MRSIYAIFLIGLLSTTTIATDQQPAPSTGKLTVEEVAASVMRTESGVTARMGAFKPIVEIYVQHVEPHQQLGTVPVRDEYFLGQFEWTEAEGPKFKRLTPEKGSRQQMSEWLGRPFATQLKPDGFVAMAVPDWRLLTEKKYHFKFLRREFLGEVRCLVMDVSPRGDPQDGFTGRIWVEDRDFNIVRFNGISRGLPGSSFAVKRYWFNVDSWRVNVSPGIWLPAYIYAEQASDDPREPPKFKGQIRLWGYDLKSIHAPQEFTTIEIDEPSVMDNSDKPQQLSPTLSQRMWEQQAEENVVERLTKAGLLSPPSEVDKVLETVLTNLQITNNLSLDPPIRVRTLLTSPLDSMTAGHTIVLSRGLIDVLPDEASLAMMLAHELAHIALGHRVIDSKFAFADKLMVPDDELLATVQYRHEAREEAAADAQVVEYLKNSPYKDKLAEAGLFLRAVNENRRLKNLIQPHVLEHVGDAGRLNVLIQKAPSLAPERIDQVAALPLGARVIVDPWSGSTSLLRAANVPLTSAREKGSLAVTPLVPYLRYAETRQILAKPE